MLLALFLSPVLAAGSDRLFQQKLRTSTKESNENSIPPGGRIVLPYVRNTMKALSEPAAISDSSRSNSNVTARGSTPGSSSVPLMVCVLPEPVLP